MPSEQREMGCGGTKMYEKASAANVILTEQQAIKRTARLERLPVHLRLGVTLAGMRELLSQLPSDALEQVNANIPLGSGERGVGLRERAGRGGGSECPGGGVVGRSLFDLAVVWCVSSTWL